MSNGITIFTGCRYRSSLPTSVAIFTAAIWRSRALKPQDAPIADKHSDIGLTLNTYTHLGWEDATDELRRMEGLENARKELEKNKEKKSVSQKMFRAI